MYDEFRPDYIGLFREGNMVWGWENYNKGIFKKLTVNLMRVGSKKSR